MSSARPTAFRSLLLNNIPLVNQSGDLYFNGYALVNTTGAQVISGAKTFSNKCYASAFEAVGSSLGVNLSGGNLYSGVGSPVLDWQNRQLLGNWLHPSAPNNINSVATKGYVDSGDITLSGKIDTVSGIASAAGGTSISVISGRLDTLSGLFTGYTGQDTARFNLLSGQLTSGVYGGSSSPTGFSTGQVCFSSVNVSMTGTGIYTVGVIPSGYMFLLDSCEIVCTRPTSNTTLTPSLPGIIAFTYSPTTSNYDEGKFHTGVEYNPWGFGYRVIEDIPCMGVPDRSGVGSGAVTLVAKVKQGVAGATAAHSGVFLMKGTVLKY